MILQRWFHAYLIPASQKHFFMFVKSQKTGLNQWKTFEFINITDRKSNEVVLMRNTRFCSISFLNLAIVHQNKLWSVLHITG